MTSSSSARPLGVRSGKNYVPDAGDIVIATFNPQAGHEQAGRRPALVISEFAFNDATGFAFLAPITGTVRRWPFEVALPAGLNTTGVILVDQAKSLDMRARNAVFAEKVPQAILDDVRDKLAAILGL